MDGIHESNMIVNSQLATSKGVDQKDKWGTPDYVFNPLNKEFGFTLDPCCEEHTAKCKTYYTPKENGLLQDWGGHIVFVNPPYSRGNIATWMRKCANEASKKDSIIVALIPVSTSSAWFHDYVLGRAKIRFIRGRVRFKGAKFTAPFSSMVAVYN